MPPTIDARGRVRLDPRDPAFFNDPYPAYAAIRAAAPAFFWEDYGFWCFAAHADVSALLRDRRFGRQILHVMSREELGWPAPKPHLAAVRRARAPFDPGDGAARAHAAPESRQPRLRLAPGREARAAHRGAGARADRRFRAPGLGRSDRGIRDARFRSPSSRTCSASRATGAADARLVASDGGDVPVRRHTARSRTARPRPRASSPISCAATHARAAPTFATTSSASSSRPKATGAGSARTNSSRPASCCSTPATRRRCTPSATASRRCSSARVDRARLSPSDRPRRDGRGNAAARPAAASLHPLRAGGRGVCRAFGLRKGEKIGLLLGAANRDPERFPRSGRLRPRPRSQSPCRLRRRHPFLRRRAARAARNGGRAADPVRPSAGLRLAETPRYRDAYHFHGLEALGSTWG